MWPGARCRSAPRRALPPQKPPSPAATTPRPGLWLLHAVHAFPFLRRGVPRPHRVPRRLQGVAGAGAANAKRAGGPQRLGQVPAPALGNPQPAFPNPKPWGSHPPKPGAVFPQLILQSGGAKLNHMAGGGGSFPHGRARHIPGAAGARGPWLIQTASLPELRTGPAELAGCPSVEAKPPSQTALPPPPCLDTETPGRERGVGQGGRPRGRRRFCVCHVRLAARFGAVCCSFCCSFLLR